MSSDNAISLDGISKVYNTYERPSDRLKQSIFTRLQRLFRLQQKSYSREFWAVKDIMFEVKKGETLGIIGKNGAGKSTLLQMICGTLNPTGGKIEVNGRVAALLELGSGFNPEFTGRDNIYMNASILGLTRDQIDDRYADIIAFAGIGDFVDQPVKTYSSGMILRLAFAVIAHVDADILIIDEALAVGDAFFVQRCMRYLREFMKTGTVLFVSHDISAIMNLCDRAVFLRKGKIVQAGVPKDVVKKYLADLYEETEAIEEAAKADDKPEKVTPLIDMREALYNNSNLRNDIEIFQFNNESEYFGTGAARIASVTLTDASGAPFAWVVGGNDVVLNVKCKAMENIAQPIIGFELKDRLGQVVFADNTFLVYQDQPVMAQEGKTISAKFSFRMPILPTGDYSITAAIADGTQESHVQLDWKYDALIVKVHNSSVCFGIVGVPMSNIKLQAE